MFDISNKDVLGPDVIVMENIKPASEQVFSSNLVLPRIVCAPFCVLYAGLGYLQYMHLLFQLIGVEEVLQKFSSMFENDFEALRKRPLSETNQ